MVESNSKRFNANKLIEEAAEYVVEEIYATIICNTDFSNCGEDDSNLCDITPAKEEGDLFQNCLVNVIKVPEQNIKRFENVNNA